MSSRTCTVCRSKVEIPKKINKNGPTQVKCPSCRSVAPLRIKLRNGKVKGLKGCFISTRFPHH